MLVLGIDTTTLVGSVGIIDETGLLGESILNIKRTHSERLMPTLSRLLEDVGIVLEDVDLISVSLGPGSFTGVRIGVTTAKTLAQALNKPLVGVYSLDVLAENLANVQGLVCPILDARKQEVYTAIYQADGTGKLSRLLDYSALGTKELLDKIPTNQERVYFLGDGVKVYGQLLKESLSGRYRTVPHNLLVPRGSTVARLGLDKWQAGLTKTNFLAIEPFYLRKSEAELAWEKKQGG